MTKYGLIRADGTQRPAYFKASRWNDGVKRHTLYTCCGTFANAWGFNNGMRTGVDGVPITSLLSLGVKDPFPATVNNVPGGVPITMVPSGSFDALVGAAANPHLFNWCPIPYPATAPISLTSLGSPPEQTGPLISLGQSISVGVAEVTSQIQSTPGTFALLGMSQGSAVISGVMQQLQSGSLTSRYGDCIGAVAFGNPCRQAGKSFPDGTDPGGAGMFPTGTTSSNMGWIRNGSTPSWWWEMATPNDPFATTPTDVSGGGDLIRSIANVALTYGGGTNGLSMLDNIFAALNYQGNLWYLVMEIVTSSGAALTSALNWAKLQGTLTPSPHILYSTLTPPTFPSDSDSTVQSLCPNGLGLTSSSNYSDIALAYINARGAAVAPR